MDDKKITTELLSELDDLLQKTNLNDVTANSTGFDELTEGYYLSEVESAKLDVSKSSGLPMISFRFKVVDKGLAANTTNNENSDTFSEITNVKNRKIFMYFVLKDESSVKRFATDMLKFEGAEIGKPILPKECFTSSELLTDALDILIGLRIYINITSSELDGKTTYWKNLISWERANRLGLPIDN